MLRALITGSQLWAFRLKLFHSNGLRSLGALLYRKGDPFAISKGSESLAFDGCVVNEHITLGLGFNETIALLLVEPFHTTFNH